MLTYQQTFSSIKSDVQWLIRENAHKEITPTTKYKTSGIYMIYIDKFDSETTIPIYIGQSVDMQRRHKEHTQGILALNRLSYEAYKAYFFEGNYSLYEGKFKACKMFKYMLENNCTLQDFHMILLEEVPQEELDAKEQAYINRFLPSFFGFNQLNSVTQHPRFKGKTTEQIANYLPLLKEDIENVYRYYDYGFTKFNFNYSMPKYLNFTIEDNPSVLAEMKETNELLDKLTEHFDYNSRYDELLRRDQITNERLVIYKDAKSEKTTMLAHFKDMVQLRLEETNRYDEEKLDNFIDKMYSKKRLELAIEKKKVDMGLYTEFKKEIQEYHRYDERETEVLDSYREACYDVSAEEKRLRGEDYKLIFPLVEFAPFTLKDNAANLALPLDNVRANTCKLNLYISNNGIDRSEDCSRETHIVKVDYRYVDSLGKITERSYFIENNTTKKCQDTVHYLEKSFNRFVFGRPVPFNLLQLHGENLTNSFISILAEYKHGINDYTVKDKPLHDLLVVFNELQSLIDEQTKFSIKISETYKCLNLSIPAKYKSHELLKKLIDKKVPIMRTKN